MNKPRAFLVSGEIHSGKTTRLQDWCENRTDVYGILTPKENGRRMFREVKSGESWEMEASEGEDFLTVGRYRFSKEGFEKAVAVLENGWKARGDRWLLFDEIGPLELRGEGFYESLKTALEVSSNENNLRILLVVRNGLEEKVEETFGLAFISFDPDLVF
jgi:nucleoside-triphosphatase